MTESDLFRRACLSRDTQLNFLIPSLGRLRPPKQWVCEPRSSTRVMAQQKCSKSVSSHQHLPAREASSQNQTSLRLCERVKLVKALLWSWIGLGARNLTSSSAGGAMLAFLELEGCEHRKSCIWTRYLTRGSSILASV